MSGATDIVTRVEAAAKAGAQSVNFYNYGLVPSARLDWVRRAISGACAVLEAQRRDSPLAG
jgi:hypothetical protein